MEQFWNGVQCTLSVYVVTAVHSIEAGAMVRRSRAHRLGNPSWTSAAAAAAETTWRHRRPG